MRLGQLAQHATDLDRASDWYSVLLGPPLARYDPPGLVFHDLGDGVRLLLEQGAPSATLERLRAAGTVVETEPHVIFRHEDSTLGPSGTDEWQAFVRDSEGNLVGLVEQRPVDRTDDRR